ncbi:hypothetical protein N3K66_008477 [Trichothecium roseum]|uniref:Uncharacterized protein n=1 Tax=Trichothecium roseum TaxID=47278 RepID=A0ACC0UQI2_9HYPO|nr:hypothetical protein N3K66_008477 [Trichothecium roseum]
MAPIGVGIIGLSSTAKTSWASGAHLPYLLSPRGKAKYAVVALCNSTPQAARAAVTAYSLPPSTKTYGDPESLAADPDVQLVVVCTRADVHRDTAMPSVKAGKDVFVEWPLAQDVARARELAEEARRAGGRTVVGMQGRLAPVLVKMRQVLAGEGRIGKVLSSEVRASGGSDDRETLASGLGYFARREVGGNIFTIGHGHLFDQVQYVLGDFTHIQSRLQLQRPDIKLRDPATGEITSTVRSDVPDLVFFTAGLSPSPSSSTTSSSSSSTGSVPIAPGASVLVRHRRGQPFPGQPALEWTINGEKGELRLISQNSTTIHAAAYASGPVRLELHDHATGAVEEVPWEWAGWQEELGYAARSIGAVYEEFAKGEGVGVYAGFGDALRRHEQLEGMLDAWAASSL